MKKIKEQKADSGSISKGIAKPHVASNGVGNILCQYGYELKGGEYWHKENDNDFRIKVGKRNITFKSKKGTQIYFVKGGADRLTFDDLSNMIQSSFV